MNQKTFIIESEVGNTNYNQTKKELAKQKTFLQVPYWNESCTKNLISKQNTCDKLKMLKLKGRRFSAKSKTKSDNEKYLCDG